MAPLIEDGLTEGWKMLSKLIKIKNVGTLRNTSAKGPSGDFRRLTMVHAENGRGKTTLCAILRSLQSGDANLILERKTLDSDEGPHVELMVDGKNVVFKNGTWSQTWPNIEVFDAAFVSDNVYSGDVISHDHKKNLCRVVIGAEGVRLAREYDELMPLAKKAGAELTIATAAVRKMIPEGLTLEAYLALAPDPKLATQIKGKNAELKVAADAAAIRIRAPLSLLEVPELPANLKEALHATVEEVSKDVEKLVRAHLARHQMDQEGETWLAEGLRYASGDNCPLCGQALADSSVIRAFGTYFGQAYRNFHATLTRLQSDLERKFGNDILLNLQKRVSANALSIEYWKQHTANEPPLLDFDQFAKPVIRTLQNSLIGLLRRKLASPLEKVEYEQATLLAISDWEKLKTSINRYNSQAESYNSAIATIKGGATTADVTVVRKEIARLEGLRARHEQPALDAIAKLTKAELTRTSAEKNKDDGRRKLDQYNASIIAAYHKKVNALLDRIGAKFTLATVEVEYTGGSPRAAYAFNILGKTIEPGSDKTSPGTPCFRNTLSSGDRNTLALAFFIAQTQARPQLGDAIVVFDDPFTSLDEFRQSFTCGIIHKLNIESAQVIVLSHSLSFLKLLAERADGPTTSKLRLAVQDGRDSRLAELDLDVATSDNITRDVVTITRYKNGDHEDALGAIRCLRPLLEHFIRDKWPAITPPGRGWLGEFIRDISNATAGTPLFDLKPHYDELNDLNAYTTKYAHDSGNSPVVNAEELRATTARVLKLLGR